MRELITKSFLLLQLFLITSGSAFPQESAKISPYISLQYFKDNDDNSFLKTTLSYSKNRMELPLPGMKITFTSGIANKKILAEIITDDKGIAALNLENKSGISLDENGMWPFSSTYEGNDTIDAIASEILIRDATLKMELTEIDSIKTIALHAEKLENGKMVPVSGELLTVYVPRMFSLLPVGEATLDEMGNASIEFPADLPGDSIGNISIIAKFEEHPEFGNVEKRTSLKWGIPPVTQDHSSHRALWTKTAPKWMIYTLSILLTGVWGHYLFALISIIRIRIDAKRKEEEDNYGK